MHPSPRGTHGARTLNCRDRHRDDRFITEKAQKAREQKLRWQEWEKPAAEKMFGDLRPSRYSDLKMRRLQNTPDAVAKRVSDARSSLAQPTERWSPRDFGIFDRRLIKDALDGFPDVAQTYFPRSTPLRADLSHVDETYTNPLNRELIESQILRGLPLGGETFYASLWPVKVEAMSRGISAEVFDNWIFSVTPARRALDSERDCGGQLPAEHASPGHLADTGERAAGDGGVSEQTWQGAAADGCASRRRAKVLEGGPETSGIRGWEMCMRQTATHWPRG
jgi:hypothetical protein